MNEENSNTSRYVRQIMLVTVCSVGICATIATIVITQTRKDYATLQHVEESLALARSSLANAIQQEAKATDEKIATLSEKIAALQKSIESLETPQTTAKAESGQTDETYYPDSVDCCSGDDQVNSSEDSSEPASVQNADEGITEEEIIEFLALIRDEDAEAHLFRSILDEDELAILAEKTTRIQAETEETLAKILENIPEPERKQVMEQMWFFNAINARVAESEAMMEMQIEQEMAVPLEERMTLVIPEGLTEEELEELENIQQETRQFMRMLEEAARE